MKKVILLFAILFACQSQLSAQGTTVPAPTYNISVIRDDVFNPGQGGYAGVGARLFIKISATERDNYFSQTDASVKNYNFPIIYPLPGSPQPVRYVKVSFDNPAMSSGYYPLTTTVGDHTTIPPVTFTPGQFGYGVEVYCTGPNQYTMMVARFECYFCPPGGGTASKSEDALIATALAPNPTKGLTYLYYTATERETMSVSVADINGKMVRTYKEDLQTGRNKVTIDLENHLAGTYIVKWRSSTGKNGVLKVVKN